MFVLGVLLLALILVIVKYVNPKEYFKLHNAMGCDIPAKLIMGHLYKLTGHGEDRMKMFKQLAKYAYSNKHGAATIRIGPFIIPVFANADQTATILKATNSKGHVSRLARRLLGNALPFATVKIWQPRRKILLPSFSSKHLSQFVHVFETQSKIIVKKLQSQVGNGNLSIWDYLSLYSLDSVCETAFGINLKIQDQESHPLFEVFNEYVKKFTKRMFFPWMRFDVLYRILPISKDMHRLQKIMYNFIDELIYKKQKLMSEGEDSIKKTEGAEPSKVTMESFLESMIKNSGESGRKYTNEELRDEVLTLALAGSDTSATGTCFTIILLSQHPDIQEKVYQEILEVLDEDRSIEMKDLQKLKYMDAVVKESLRLYPPVPFLTRYLKEETKLPSGIVVPYKQTVGLNIWGIHHNPQHWGPDVEEFNPDRFLCGPPPAAGTFMPFSMGPRNCIGYQYAMLSMKTTLVTLLRAYRLKPATSFTYGKDNPLRVTCDIMIRHVNNFEIQIEYRKCQ